MNIPSTVKAALIDMDGVLYDSMPMHARAWKRVADHAGIPATYDEFFLYEGSTGASTIDKLIRRTFGRPATDDEKRDLYALKAEFFVEQGQVPIMPGAQRMVQTLLDNGVITVLVTGSGQNSLLSRLETDFPGAFPPERRITSASVTHGKPHPEPYLKGLALSGAEASQAMVFDNAPLGVKSGHEAGIYTVGLVTGPVPAHELKENGADNVIISVEKCADMLFELFKNKND